MRFNLMSHSIHNLVALALVLVLSGCTQDQALPATLAHLHSSGASESEVQAGMAGFDAGDMGLKRGEDAPALLKQFCGGAVEAEGGSLLAEHHSYRLFSTPHTTVFAFFDGNGRLAGYVMGGQ